MFSHPAATVVRRFWLITGSLALAAALTLLIRDQPILAALLALAALVPSLVLLAVADHRIGQHQDELDHAYTDPVTGLPVRVVAEQFLREAAGTAVTVALIDLDDFHDFNYAHTHQGGDALLAIVADRLQSIAQPGDLAARLGGDEFVFASPRWHHTVARALDIVSQEPAQIGPAQVPVRVSIGICRCRRGDPADALGRADLAMFAARRDRTGLAYYDPVAHGAPHTDGPRPVVRPRDRARRPADNA